MTTYGPIELTRDMSIERVRQETKRWLVEHQFWRPGQTVPEMMKELSGFRKNLRKNSPEDGDAWARIILSKHADGKPVSKYALDLAKSVVEMSERRRQTELFAQQIEESQTPSEF